MGNIIVCVSCVGQERKHYFNKKDVIKVKNKQKRKENLEKIVSKKLQNITRNYVQNGERGSHKKNSCNKMGD